MWYERTSDAQSLNGPDRGNDSTNKSLSTEWGAGRESMVTQSVNQARGKAFRAGESRDLLLL